MNVGQGRGEHVGNSPAKAGGLIVDVGMRQVDAREEAADEADVSLGIETVLGQPARQDVFGEVAQACEAQERMLSGGLELTGRIVHEDGGQRGDVGWVGWRGQGVNVVRMVLGGVVGHGGWVGVGGRMVG